MKPFTKLSTQVLDKHLRKLSGWSITTKEASTLTKQYTFKNFIEAMDFVNKVAKLAEEAKHHPDILISYNKVTLQLTTHEAGGLTEKDATLANAIEEIYSPIKRTKD